MEDDQPGTDTEATSQKVYMCITPTCTMMRSVGCIRGYCAHGHEKSTVR